LGVSLSDTRAFIAKRTGPRPITYVAAEPLPGSYPSRSTVGAIPDMHFFSQLFFA
jgi:hypothetical protein